ncbi:MAG: glycosyltransferase [Treponema phagedenis]|uniref:glycosyltransferase family 32 protein n=1 Tax=Treponema phagedenis TaxID=162 RepID=UPI00313403DD
MIPKIIHYCWFGGNPLPDLAVRCIESWRKYCPDYEIREWNESNYDVCKIPYTAQAYEAKKYAFVSDYARFDVLYQYGGVYFDTDVEVLKPIDELLERGAFFGFETLGFVNPGVGFALPPHHKICAEIIETYTDDVFITPHGGYNLATIVDRVTDVFKKYGLVKRNVIQCIGDTAIYPIDYFNPKNPQTGIITITDNTYTIHHFAASWTTPLRKEYMRWYKRLCPKIGALLTTAVLYPFRVVCILQEYGYKGLLVKFVRKYRFKK